MCKNVIYTYLHFSIFEMTDQNKTEFIEQTLTAREL